MLCFNIMHNYIVEIQETSLTSMSKYTGKDKAISNTILIVTNSGNYCVIFQNYQTFLLPKLFTVQ